MVRSGTVGIEPNDVRADVFDVGAIIQELIDNSTSAILQRIQAYGHKTPSHSDQELALTTLQRAISVPGVWHCVRRLLIALATKMEQAGAPLQWVQLLEYGLHESQRLQDRETEATLAYHLGSVYRIWTRLEESQQLFEQSADAFAQMKQPDQQAFSLCHAADVARLQQKRETAKALVEFSFALLDQDPIPLDSSVSLTIGYGHLVLGAIALEQKELQMARQNFETALQVYQETDTLRMAATTQGNLGVVYAELGQYDAALDAYTQAVNIFSEMEEVIQSTRFQMNMGNVYLYQDDWPKAIAMFSIVEPIYRQTGDKLSLANCWFNLGLAYRGLEEFNQSQRALQDAMRLYEELERTSDAMDTLAELGVTYQMQSLYHEAIAAFEKVQRYLITQESTPDIIQFQKELAKYLPDVMSES